MKKILTFAAIVAAVAVQAASVSWKVQGQSALNGYNVAFVDSSTITALIGGASPYSDAAALSAAIAAEEGYDTDGLAAALTAVKTVSRGAASGSVDAVGASIVAIFWKGTPADGGEFLYGTFSTSGYTYEKPATPTATLSITAADLSSGTFKEAYAAVPEPTTVALLALGLAAVGLKRKVA